MIQTLLLRIQNDETLSEEEKLNRMKAVKKCWNVNSKRLLKKEEKIEKEQNEGKKFILLLEYFRVVEELRCASLGLNRKEEIRNPFYSVEERAEITQKFFRELREEMRQRNKHN